MPGLIRGVARTAVIAGTATAVSNNVSRRQANRWAEQNQSQAYAQQQYEQQQYAQQQALAQQAAAQQAALAAQQAALGQHNSEQQQAAAGSASDIHVQAAGKADAAQVRTHAVGGLQLRQHASPSALLPPTAALQPEEEQAARAALARGPEFLVHITAGNLPPPALHGCRQYVLRPGLPATACSAPL